MTTPRTRDRSSWIRQSNVGRSSQAASDTCWFWSAVDMQGLAGQKFEASEAMPSQAGAAMSRTAAGVWEMVVATPVQGVGSTGEIVPIESAPQTPNACLRKQKLRSAKAVCRCPQSRSTTVKSSAGLRLPPLTAAVPTPQSGHEDSRPRGRTVASWCRRVTQAPFAG